MKKIEADSPISHSADLTDENLERLGDLFPSVFIEGEIDFDALRELLGGMVAEQEEKYRLTWPGKRRSQQLAHQLSTGTLRPCPEESVNWETTQNVMIEGDNLEVLKLLQKSYDKSVKLIYIDPPYNTGNDFVYSDSFTDGVRSYLEFTGQVTGEGKKSSSNTEVSGRYHSSWLSMMYPRLFLARNLLRDDGVIFISIDDHEVDNLRKICAEIFGEENFIAQFVWNTEGHTDNQFEVKGSHEYVLLYAKNADLMTLGHVVDPNTRKESNLLKGYAENSITKNGPGNPPSEIELPPGFPCLSETLDLEISDVPDEFFEEAARHRHITRELTRQYAASYPIRIDPMRAKEGRLTEKCRVYSGWANVNKLRAFIANGCRPLDDNGDKLSFHLSNRGVVYYRRERSKARNIVSVLRNMGTTERMRSELEKLGIPFQYPKPKELLRYLIQIGLEGDGIVLDFFAGSGTTAHATMLQNAEDGKQRRYILVQLPERLDPRNRNQSRAVQFCDALGKPRTIAEVTKEYLRRAGQELSTGAELFPSDTGYRVFKLDTSNIRAWNPDPDDLEATLLDSVEHVLPDRTEQDLLHELLLKSGIDLCESLETREFAGVSVRSVAYGTLFTCLADEITTAMIDPIAKGIAAWHQELDPAGESVVVFRDSAFPDDVAKSNMTAILEQGGIGAIRSL
jgi:adenine-specific DNA-methyltransferase